MKILSVFILALLCLASSNTLAQKTYSWRLFGNLNQSRWRYEIQSLSNDKLLVMGGRIPNNATTNTCEIIDVAKGIVYNGPSMLNNRTDFPSVIDKDSNIYVFGGFTEDKTISDIECYSPRTNSWRKVGNMVEPRMQHTAVLISPYSVLIVGGRDSNQTTISSSEIFDIRTGKSRQTAPLPFLINNGMSDITSNAKSVVFAGRSGGHSSTQTSDVMMFDEKNEIWIKIDTLPISTTSMVYTKLFNGAIAFSGGKNEKSGNDWLTEVVLEKDGKFGTIGNMSEGRHYHWIVQLDEKTLITGGGLKTWSSKSSKTTDVISIKDGKQQNGPEMLFARKNAKAVSMPIMKNGKVIKPRVLVISGVDDKFLSSIEILDETPTISGIINTYTPVTQLLGKHTSQIKVKNTEGFSVGDKVLIMQMQGAEANYSITSKVDRVIDYRNAGNHEFGRVTNINGNVIALERQLTLPYSVSSKVQLILVPEYSDVVVNGELTCKPWDGETGGVLAFKAYGTVSMNANINVNGKGFRGGHNSLDKENSVLFVDQSFDYVHSAAETTTSGEGIIFSDKQASKAAIGNGGGAGLSNNTGGAGGANISCGGNGGIGWVSEFSLLDNLVSKGGSPLEYNGKRVFMGGGGGSGHTDDNETGNGGNGGGIIFISAKNLLVGDFSISANGMNGDDGSLDGSGGGGAGGCICLDIEELNQEMYVYTSGGNGGNNVISKPDAPGAGSGGGGGGGTVLLTKPNINIIVTNNGGVNGIAATVFDDNKAIAGCHGVIVENVKIIDGSDNSKEGNRFIKDCLNEDCSEYVQAEQERLVDTTQIGDIYNNEYETSKGFLYPNPASDFVTVTTVTVNNLTMFDSIGNILKLPFTENQLSVTFNVSSLQNGVYFIRDNQKTSSFVVKR